MLNFNSESDSETREPLLLNAKYCRGHMDIEAGSGKAVSHS